MHNGMEPAIWSVIPFILILLCIAFFPLVLEHWWHSNRNKFIVSMVLGIPVAVYLIIIGRFEDLEHQIILDYIPFVSLLAALYFISGGIVLRGDIPATPLNNTLFLFLGSILASFIGTTGASMLLIRPVIKSNSERKYVAHTIIFFIFLVSNIGGLLTPLGDPPLFLGYLRGVPFTWTFRLIPEWLFTVGLVLLLYYIWDYYAYKKETKVDIIKDTIQVQPLQIKGSMNFLWLLGVILIVAFVNENYEPFKTLIHQNEFYKLIQVPLFFVLILLSKFTTPEEYRKENDFNLYPIIEVAALFIGIFITMVPALILLKIHGHELGIQTPIQYFYATGFFSSFLDNAPTYLVFFTTAQGMMSIQEFIQNHPLILAGVSLGSVFMGSMTYIGNAPNFMVRSIAEQSGIKMPSFFGYMIYSIFILQPIFFIMALIFL